MLYYDTNIDIYIWSNSFNNYNQIQKVLENYYIKNTIISTYNANPKKLINFKERYDSQFLISKNEFIYPENKNKLLKKVQLVTKYGKTIHLNIEPHAMEDLKNQKNLYLNYYIQMLKNIKENFPFVTINISIPTFYDVDYVNKMQKYVDKIYLMAYEFQNYHQLLNRISKYKNLNIVIALSCKDFSSKKELFETINKLKQDGYKNFAIHDFETFIKLKD